MAKVLDLTSEEATLGELGSQLVLAKSLKGLLQQRELTVDRAREESQVIKIGSHPPVRHSHEHLVHRTLEQSRCVAETEGHTLEVIEPLLGRKRGLLLVLLVDLYLPVTRD